MIQPTGNVVFGIDGGMAGHPAIYALCPFPDVIHISKTVISESGYAYILQTGRHVVIKVENAKAKYFLTEETDEIWCGVLQKSKYRKVKWPMEGNKTWH